MRFLKLILICFIPIYLQAQTTKDMLWRDVKIPDSTDRIFSAAPPMSVLLYALAPEKMIGVNYQFMPTEKKYMLKSVENLPILGSFFSGGGQANFEKVVALRPDLIFMWDITRVRGGFFEKEAEKLNIPMAYIQQNSIEQMKDALLSMGKFLKKERRAIELVEYANYNLSRVKKSVSQLKQSDKKRVFLADGADGLKTMCDKDMHAQSISFSGGINVYKCPEGTPKKANITLEKLYKLDPDVIFVWNPTFYKSLDKNTPWRNLRAFKNKQIYFAPMSPFNWLSRPPSIMRFLGVVWMHHKLYPKHFNVNIKKEIKDFYQLFLHVNLTDKDVQKLLKGE